MAISLEQAQNLEPLHRAIGNTLSRWAYLEDRVFDVFQVLMGNPHQVCLTVFYQHQALERRLGLLGSVASISLADTGELSHLRDLIFYTDKMREKRNFIAHNPVTVRVWDAVQQGNDVTIRLAPAAVISSSYEAEHKGRQGRLMMTEEVEQLATDIETLAAHFVRLAHHLRVGTARIPECEARLVEPKFAAYGSPR